MLPLPALQILALCDALDKIDADEIAACESTVSSWFTIPGWLGRGSCAGAGMPPALPTLPPLPSCRAPADIAGLQQPDGSFWGDEWGEVRVSVCSR